MRRKPDLLTPDLFEVPVPASALPGELDYSLAIRRLLVDAIKESGISSAIIAARMGELTGATISEHQLHSWTAPSRDGWRFPLEYLPAFEVACDTHAVSSWLCKVRGGRMLIGRDAFNAEIGRLERMRDEAGKRIKALKAAAGEIK
ncbi:hypothetical protein [Rhodocyclus tenuis]|uniref:Uncharacterized protein n=1 Tax=Rhodocyclus tenuis TaxID=1066 RepID=A0A840GGF9_RHOTE|nr:hypothetical protein [Rhodocyclus tenuis]MBB4247289.1 hypothetical protein [Rhodocyclus tenuis]